MKGYLFVLMMLLTQQVFSAELTNVRSGETAGVSRLVLEADALVSWQAQVDSHLLQIQLQDTQPKVEKELRALKASGLGKILVSSNKKSVTVDVQLTQSMRLVKKQIITRSGEPVRYVLDLVPDHKEIASAVKSVKSVEAGKKTAVSHVVAPVASQNTTISKPVIPAVVKNTPIGAGVVVKVAADELKTDKLVDDKPVSVVRIKPFKGTKDLVIAIDAGHGGKDVGATSQSGALEKDITLAMAKALKAEIDAQPGMRAVLTRDDDYFISLRKRPQLAREMGADVFISLHADTYKDSRISGASFYVLSPKGATSQLAKFVASHSNEADVQGKGLEPWSEKLASDIGHVALENVTDDSQKMAELIRQSMKHSGIRLQHSSVQAANFVVLKNIDMPSVLVEMGFISNPQQDKLLQDTKYQQKMAASMVSGLLSFAQVQPEPGVVYAKLKVVKGDSLASIAKRHGTTVTYLARANGLKLDTPLKAGQLLSVPVNMSQRLTAMTHDDRG